MGRDGRVVQVEQIETIGGTSTGGAGQIRPTDAVLRRALVASDIVASGAAWTLAMVLATEPDHPGADAVGLLGWAAAAALSTVAALTHEQLYLTRVWGVRALEVQRVGRGSLAAAALIVVLDHVAAGPLAPLTAALAVLLTWGLVIGSRTTLLHQLHATPRPRADHRALLLADDPSEGRRVLDLLVARPQLGYQAIGFVSPQRPPVASSVPWLGTPGDLPVLARLTAATSVIVAGDSFTPGNLSRALEQLQPLDVHTHLIARHADDALHVRVLPVPHRGVATTEQSLTTPQRAAKRVFDLAVGGALALLTLPVLAVTAVVLRIATGGPVLERSVCSGPRGESVVVRRLHTRLPDTAALAGFGRACNRLGIDKLPQLLDVLAGSMTLIGPAPRRTAGGTPAPVDVRAGLISLRHVETPAYPELGDHRRTDEFYVENWSIGLDLSILAACASDLVWRGLRGVTGICANGTAAI